MKLVVGIGNPGKNYENTRHNVGFDTLNVLSEKLNVSFDKQKFGSLICKVAQEDEQILLLKPLTYVNLSGGAVSQAMSYFDISLEDVLVICDDFNLELGSIRIKSKGSSGGHKGIQSIINSLRTNEFSRIKIGIGEPDKIDPADFVLSQFSKKEREWIDVAINQTADAIIFWWNNGIEMCMNKFKK